MAPRKTAAPKPRAATDRLATRLESAARASIKILREQEAPFALIGGIALGLRVAPRATQDVDFAVAIDDAAAERLVHAFQASGFQIDAVLVNKGDRTLATVRVHDPKTKVLVDLLISFCGIEQEIVNGATLERWRDLMLPVVSRGHLIAMKVLANRKQDQADLESLLRVLREEDKRQALHAVKQIMAAHRGHGRDLEEELKRLLVEVRPVLPPGFELRAQPAKRRRR